MVSGTRCPAWSDQLEQWSESRAAAPKGRCPVGHRGEFPYVRPSVRPSVRTSPPPRPLWPKSGSFRPEISPMRPKSTLSDLKSPLQVQNWLFQIQNQPSRPKISPIQPKISPLGPLINPFRPLLLLWPLWSPSPLWPETCPMRPRVYLSASASGT